jgi:hypothetical protein
VPATENECPFDPYFQSAELLLAVERAEVVKAIAGRISKWFICRLQAGSDYLSRHILVVRPFLFFLFACRANRLMIVNGQDSLISLGQGLLATPTLAGT